MLLILSSSISAPSLCSAFAIADSTTFFTMPAAFFGENVRTFSALSTGKPRIWSATRRVFLRRDAGTAMNCFHFHLDCPLFLGLLVGRVTLERTGQCELAKLVADHVFRDVHRNVLTAVVNSDRQAD
eukprot:RCo040896